MSSGSSDNAARQLLDLVLEALIGFESKPAFAISWGIVAVIIAGIGYGFKASRGGVLLLIIAGAIVLWIVLILGGWLTINGMT